MTPSPLKGEGYIIENRKFSKKIVKRVRDFVVLCIEKWYNISKCYKAIIGVFLRKALFAF
jgi:hypothetical protein